MWIRISPSSSSGTTAASTGTPRSKRSSDWPHTMSRRAIGTSLAAPIPVRAPRRSGVHHVEEKQRVECAETVLAKSGPTAKLRLRKRVSRYMWTTLGQRDKPRTEGDSWLAEQIVEVLGQRFDSRSRAFS